MKKKKFWKVVVVVVVLTTASLWNALTTTLWYSRSICPSFDTTENSRIKPLNLNLLFLEQKKIKTREHQREW